MKKFYAIAAAAAVTLSAVAAPKSLMRVDVDQQRSFVNAALTTNVQPVKVKKFEGEAQMTFNGQPVRKARKASTTLPDPAGDYVFMYKLTYNNGTVEQVSDNAEIIKEESYFEDETTYAFTGMFASMFGTPGEFTGVTYSETTLGDGTASPMFSIKPGSRVLTYDTYNLGVFVYLVDVNTGRGLGIATSWDIDLLYSTEVGRIQGPVYTLTDGTQAAAYMALVAVDTTGQPLVDEEDYFEYAVPIQEPFFAVPNGKVTSTDLELGDDGYFYILGDYNGSVYAEVENNTQLVLYGFYGALEPVTFDLDYANKIAVATDQYAYSLTLTTQSGQQNADFYFASLVETEEAGSTYLDFPTAYILNATIENTSATTSRLTIDGIWTTYNIELQAPVIFETGYLYTFADETTIDFDFAFKNLGVNDVAIDNNANAPVEYFNLQGIRVAQPAAGNIYIRRQGNDVKKVLVK